MQRVSARISIIFLVLVIGLGVGWLVRLRANTPEPEIPPIKSEYTCVQPATTDSFEEFWSNFQSAVKAEDRKTLLSLTDRCGFVWWDWQREGVQLKTANELVAGWEAQPSDPVAVNSALVFESQDDFDKNYAILFAPKIRRYLLSGKLTRLSDGRFEIRWHDDRLSSTSLNFSRVDGAGYKFIGLDWEPVP